MFHFCEGRGGGFRSLYFLSKNDMKGHVIETTKALCVQLFYKHMGVLSPVLEELKINRDTVAEWRKKDPEFDAKMTAAKEQRLDFVESALFKKIAEGDTSAIKFYLRTQGRSRGYIEQTPFDDKFKEGDDQIKKLCVAFFAEFEKK